MRLFKLAAAIGLMAGSLGLTTAASAQHRDVRIENRADYNRHVLGVRDGRDVSRRDDHRYDRRDRHDNRGYNHDRRRDWGRDGYRNARNCRTIWRDHRKVRVCR